MMQKPNSIVIKVFIEFVLIILFFFIFNNPIFAQTPPSLSEFDKRIFQESCLARFVHAERERVITFAERSSVARTPSPNRSPEKLGRV